MQASLHKWFPSAKTMLKETIYSSLFILASKRNRVRVGYEKDLFCARLLRRAYSPHITCSSLSGTHIPPFPPTRFILEPPVVGTEKPLFFCVLFRKRRVISQCLLLMQYAKNPLSGAPRHESCREPTRFRVFYPPDTRA